MPDALILVVDDDAPVRRMLRRSLLAEGYEVAEAADGGAALAALERRMPDLVVLDVTMPGVDGLAVSRRLRARGNPVPILMLTARDALEERVRGLDAGADDYLVKPFDLDELLARARAVIRRQRGRSSPETTYGQLSLDPVTRVVMFRGAAVDLSAREFAVLEALMKEPGAVVSREKLEDAVYGWGEEVGSNSIEVHLHHLRRKLSAELIRNVRGVGYRIALLS